MKKLLIILMMLPSVLMAQEVQDDLWKLIKSYWVPFGDSIDFLIDNNIIDAIVFKSDTLYAEPDLLGLPTDTFGYLYWDGNKIDKTPYLDQFYEPDIIDLIKEYDNYIKQNVDTVLYIKPYEYDYLIASESILNNYQQLINISDEGFNYRKHCKLLAKDKYIEIWYMTEPKEKATFEGFVEFVVNRNQ